MLEIFRNMWRRKFRTFLIVTHNMEIASTCKTIIRLKDGKNVK